MWYSHSSLWGIKYISKFRIKSCENKKIFNCFTEPTCSKPSSQLPSLSSITMTTPMNNSMRDGSNHSNVPDGMLKRHLPQQFEDGICWGLNLGFPCFFGLGELVDSVIFIMEFSATVKDSVKLCKSVNSTQQSSIAKRNLYIRPCTFFSSLEARELIKWSGQNCSLEATYFRNNFSVFIWTAILQKLAWIVKNCQ